MNIDIEKPNFKQLVLLNMQQLTNFPYIEKDFDAITDYQLLCKVVEYLNDVITNQNTTNDTVVGLYNAFITLKDYVDNYFTNLDVQDEINNKLEEMYQNGELEEIISSYINRDIMPLINTQNAQISVINQKVDSALNGSPIPVDSMDDMTDTDKIYVYVVDGNWYYYNGSAWVSGGVYQSSQNIDDIDGLLDYYNNKNIKGLINWQIGNIGNKSGDIQDGNYLVVTTDMLEYKEDIYIDISSYTNTTIYLYDTDGTYLRYIDIGQNENKGYFIPAYQKFRLKLNYVTEPEGGRPSLVGQDPKETNLYLNLNLYRYADYKEMQFVLLANSGNSFEYDNLKNYHELILGDFGDTGLNQNKNNYRRILPAKILQYKKDVVISSRTPAEAFIWYYSDAEGNDPTRLDWYDIYNNPVTIPANQCFRYVVSEYRSYNVPILYVYNNDIFKNLVINFQKQENVSVLNPNIHYINSIAHQGYSETDTYNRSKAGGYIRAKEKGFNYGETDIRFTLDGIPVCAHDATFVSDGITIVIADETLAQLKTYDYYGGTIASFEEIVAECKSVGLGLYIDHLVNSWTDAQWNSLFNIVKKYQMQDNVVWSQTTSNVIANKILSFYKYSKIVIVTSDSDLTNVINFANNIKTDYNKVGLQVNYSNFTTSQINQIIQNLNPEIKFEVWTIDNLQTCKEYMPYVSGITSNKYSVIDMLS